MSETVNFVQGSKRNYDSSTMQGGVYFSKDSKEIFLNGESYGNAVPADEEDLTSVNGALQLKDREVDTTNFQSKGYVILRKNLRLINGVVKNILTQDMINQANTIYVIRYDFTLGDNINIPANCVLKFDGGSISNGTIIGDSYEIVATKKKIFNNVLFSGLVAEQYIFEADWFTNNTTNGIISDTSIDASTDLNAALSSGICNIRFSADKYYHISSPLIINGHVDIYSDKPNIGLEGNGFIQASQKGCIYSNNIITLLEYHFKVTENYKRGSLYIGPVDFYCNKFESDSTNDNVPIIKILNEANQALWGMELLCNITDCADKWIFRHTGLYIKAITKGIAFVNLRGNIQTVYRGFYIEADNSLYVNDITVFGNTRCVQGGVCIGSCAPLNIYGGHQPEGYIWPNGNNDFGYFEGKWINQYSYIWDTGGDNALVDNYGAIKHQIKITSDINQLVTYNSANYNSLIPTGDIGTYRRLFNKAESLHNVLSTYLTTDPLVTLDYYKIGNDSIFDTTKFVLYNSHYLFNGEEFIHSIKYSPVVYHHDYSAIKTLNNIISGTTLEFSFRLVPSILYSGEKNIFLLLAIPNQLSNSDAHINITGKYVRNNETISETIIDNYIPFGRWYYTNSTDIIKSKQLAHNNEGITYSEITITVTCTLNSFEQNTLLTLPSICIPFSYKREIVFGGTTAKRPVFINEKGHKGFVYFNTDINKQTIYNGSSWDDIYSLEDVIAVQEGRGSIYSYLDINGNIKCTTTFDKTVVKELYYVPFNSALDCNGDTTPIIKVHCERFKVKSAISAFNGNVTITDIGDVSNMFVENPDNLYGFCRGATALTKIVGMSNWKVSPTTLVEAFYGCTGIVSMDLPPINCTTNSAFYNMTSLTTIPASGKISKDVDFKQSPLTRESILVIFNALDPQSVGTVKLKQTSYNLLSVDDLAIATNKGWTVSTT